MLARLHHTHVVAIFAAGHVGDTHYFAMPFIDGVSLRETVRTLSAGDAPERSAGQHPAARLLAADAWSRARWRRGGVAGAEGVGLHWNADGAAPARLQEPRLERP